MTKVSELVSQNVNSAIINYQTWGSLLINVKVYGAKGDGSDDTAAINSAIAALIAAGGGVLYFPTGNYKVSSNLATITVTTQIVGSGNNSVIYTLVDGVTIFTINAYFCRVNHLQIQYSGTGTPTSGSGILISALDHTAIEGCNIHNFYINIDTLNAAYFTIFNNYLTDPIKYNIRVQNVNSPDAGDSQILGNKLFASGNPNIDAHIYQRSSGGLRIVDNKFLYGKVGIQSSMADGVTTSILIITGNSIELQSDKFIYAKRENTTGLLEFINITGNELRSDTINNGIVLDDGSDTSVIVGNILHGQNTNTASGIQINNSAKDVVIDGNMFQAWATGITLNFSSGNNSRATIGANQFADSVTYNFKNIGYIQDSAIDADNHYTNNFAVSDNVTYQNVFQMDLVTYSGGTIILDMFGILNGAGSFARTVTKLINRDAAGITATAVTDVAVGQALDVQFDVTTVSGSVIVKVRKSSTTGTTVAGTMSIKVRGGVIGFKAFNTV